MVKEIGDQTIRKQSLEPRGVPSEVHQDSFCASVRHPHLEEPIQQQSAISAWHSRAHQRQATQASSWQHLQNVRKTDESFESCAQGARYASTTGSQIKVLSFSKGTVHRRSPLTLLKCLQWHESDDQIAFVREPLDEVSHIVEQSLGSVFSPDRKTASSSVACVP